MYVGIDFHKRNTYVTKMDEEGNLTESRNLVNESGALEEFVDSLTSEDKVVLEATGNWYHFYELVEDKALSITLSHPAKTRAIASARIKTDKIDSAMLAHLLRTNLIPASYIPERATRDLREVLRYRASLVWYRASLKNKIRAILSKNGLSCPYSDLFGKKSRAWLASISPRDCYRESLAGYLVLADTLALEIGRVEEKVQRIAEESPEARLLMTMHGLSYYSSLLVLSEIGEIDRFPSAGQLQHQGSGLVF
ncbi:MAG: transposase [Actinomycetota bacterium]|nr:transposase [Actinomycetota bacterium]